VPIPDDVRAVLLDVGGVFHLPDHDRIVDAMGRAGVTVDPAELDRAHYAGVRALTNFREGDRAVWLAYNRGYAAALGAGDRVEAVAEILLSEFTTGGVWTRIIPGSRDGLAELKARGVRLAIVSNADGSVEAQLADDGICQVGPGPGVEVDAVLDSSVVGVAKPDPRCSSSRWSAWTSHPSTRSTWATPPPPTSTAPPRPGSHRCSSIRTATTSIWR